MPKKLLSELSQTTIFDAKLWMTEAFDEILVASNLGYSDGTRGQAYVPLSVRPAAFGAATFQYKVTNGIPECTDIQYIGGEATWRTNGSQG